MKQEKDNKNEAQVPEAKPGHHRLRLIEGDAVPVDPKSKPPRSAFAAMMANFCDALDAEIENIMLQ